MDLNELIVDIDYQQKYSYEQRVHLFNKYHISQTNKFFVPIWALSNFITDLCGITFNRGYQEFGHGQTVLNASLKDNTVKKQNETYPRIQVLRPGTINIHYYIPNIEEHPRYGRLRKVVGYDLLNKTVSVNNYGSPVNMCNIPRNLYGAIDQWLIDFGYLTTW